MMNDHEGSDSVVVAIGCGAGGAKGGTQGECEPTKRTPGRTGKVWHLRWIAYGKPQGKEGRRRSLRSSIISTRKH